MVVLLYHLTFVSGGGKPKVIENILTLMDK